MVTVQLTRWDTSKIIHLHVGSAELQTAATLTWSQVTGTPPGCHHREQCFHTGCCLESCRAAAPWWQLSPSGRGARARSRGSEGWFKLAGCGLLVWKSPSTYLLPSLNGKHSRAFPFPLTVLLAVTPVLAQISSHLDPATASHSSPCLSQYPFPSTLKHTLLLFSFIQV